MVRGAARYVRRHHPRADNYFLGNWLCRDPGHVTWCPPVLAGLGRVDKGPTAVVAPPYSSSIEQQKAALRCAMKQKRCVPLPRERSHLVHRLTRLIHAFGKQTVAAVWPLPEEIDLRPLCFLLHRAGYDIVLPETPPRGEGLVFRLWTPQSRLRSGRFGTKHPVGAQREPDLILVPLLAFDRCGGRLGYGGGYYDRTLSVRPHVITIGYALSQQEHAEVPMDKYDQRLSYIVTEREIIETTKPMSKG